MESKESSKVNEKLGINAKRNEIIGFFGQLIQTILPRHTVIIILIGVMGYLLFYPTVKDPQLYEALIKSDFHSPFIYVYFIFGLIYLSGGMFLTLKVHQEETEKEKDKDRLETEVEKLEIETRSRPEEVKNRGLLAEDKMVEYFKEKLNVPEGKIERVGGMGIARGMNIRADVVIIGKQDEIIAVAEAKAWSTRFGVTSRRRELQGLEKYATAGAIGCYLFIMNEENLESMSFYDFEQKQEITPPTYNELLGMAQKTK